MTANLETPPLRVPPNQNEKQESSSIETPTTTPSPSTWGEYKQEIPVLGLWNEYQPPKQPNYLHRYCFSCEAAMVTLNPFKILICHECKQDIKNEDIPQQNLCVNEGRDDEEEFVFQDIPIAGENKGDSEEDWYYSDESEQEEEVLHQNFTSILINADATEDIAFLVGPTQD